MSPAVLIRRTRWTVVVGACILVAPNAVVGAQRPASVKQAASPSTRARRAPGVSTSSGVYTEAQAKRGSEVYLGTCRSCHSPESHTGATFDRLWQGKTLADLYTYISLRMPKNDPGTLAAEDVADVMAYLLKMNRMPVGKAEIYPDPDSLKKFRIDVKPRRSGTSTTQRTKP